MFIHSVFDPLNFVSKNISKMLSQSLFKLTHNLGNQGRYKLS